MRPTPNELIAGIRRVLRDVVAPEVASEYASTRLRQIIAHLRDVDWDEVAFTAWDEAREALNLVAECQAWIDATPARRTCFAISSTEIQAILSDAGTEIPVNPTFARANAQGLACRQALAHFIEVLQAASADGNKDPGILEIRQRLWTYFVRKK